MEMKNPTIHESACFLDLPILEKCKTIMYES